MTWLAALASRSSMPREPSGQAVCGPLRTPSAPSCVLVGRNSPSPLPSSVYIRCTTSSKWIRSVSRLRCWSAAGTLIAATCMRASCESERSAGFHSSTAVIRSSAIRRIAMPTKSPTSTRPSCASTESAITASASHVARSPSPSSAAASMSTASIRAAMRRLVRYGSRSSSIGN